MTGMTENETGVIEVAIEKAPEAREETETIEKIEIETIEKIEIETIVEDERIVISDMIVRVLETEGTEL